MQTLMTAAKGAGMMTELPILRLLQCVPLPSTQMIFNANEPILKAVRQAVEAERLRKSEFNLFGRVLAECEKEGENKLDDVDVAVEASMLLIAGTDTTGITLTYFVYAVLRRPELQKALEDEAATLSPNFTEQDISKLPLLSATIEETLRLYGAAPGSLPRVVPSGGAMMAGHFIPEGTIVSTQAYTFHRDAAIWQSPLE